MSAVMSASVSRKMVPVLWDTGGDISRQAPYAASPELVQTLQNFAAARTAPAPAPAAPAAPAPAAPAAAPPAAAAEPAK
jgi:2-oxoglutarate dehydrogenase E2 component (dihydrolipoamide succinyltransferase)